MSNQNPKQPPLILQGSNPELFYAGKVRDVYTLYNNYLAIVSSDRVSAYDHVFPELIPNKGQVLTQISIDMFRETENICPNHVREYNVAPNAIIADKCTPFKFEVIVRGNLEGSAWRAYEKGERTFCGASLKPGLKRFDFLSKPIITPTTKEEVGVHDKNITPKEIVSSCLATQKQWNSINGYALALFKKGCEIAKKRGLILVDTKYEFGINESGQIVLIDEIHTPDSSRYLYLEGFTENQANGIPHKQLSKEVFREWLAERGFTGEAGQERPVLTKENCLEIRDRYIELFEQLTGKKFVRSLLDDSETVDHINRSMTNYRPATSTTEN